MCDRVDPTSSDRGYFSYTSLQASVLLLLVVALVIKCWQKYGNSVKWEKINLKLNALQHYNRYSFIFDVIDWINSEHTLQYIILRILYSDSSAIILISITVSLLLIESRFRPTFRPDLNAIKCISICTDII